MFGKTYLVALSGSHRKMAPPPSASPEPSPAPRPERSPFSVIPERHPEPCRGRSRSRHRRRKSDRNAHKKREERQKTPSSSPPRARSAGRKRAEDPQPVDRSARPKSPPVAPKTSERKASHKPVGQSKCPHCWKMVSNHKSSRRQHEWLSAYCIQWQVYATMTKDQKKNADGWKQAGKIAAEVRDRRLSEDIPAPRSEVDRFLAVSNPAVCATQDVRKNPKTQSKEDKTKTTSVKDKQQKKVKKDNKRVPTPSESSSHSPSQEEKPGKKSSRKHGSIVINIAR